MTWRCTTCSINWPMFKQYYVCPGCGEKCWSAPNTEPINVKEAEQLVARFRADTQAAADYARLHQEFEERYAEREVERFRKEMDAWLAAQLT